MEKACKDNTGTNKAKDLETHCLLLQQQVNLVFEFLKIRAQCLPMARKSKKISAIN